MTYLYLFYIISHLILTPFIATVGRIKGIEYVAHALGEYSHMSLTNSIEAFNENQSRYDFFEVDLIQIADSEFICLHGPRETSMSLGRNLGWEEIKSLTTIDFFNFRSLQPYKACTLAELIEALSKSSNKKAHLVLDLKDADEKLSAVDIYKYLVSIYPKLEEISILQLYNYSDYRDWLALSPKPKAAITLYRLSRGDAASFVWRTTKDKRLLWITMYLPYLLSEVGLTALILDRDVYVNTINDAFTGAILSIIGVKGVYTDTLHR